MRDRKRPASLTNCHRLLLAKNGKEPFGRPFRVAIFVDPYVAFVPTQLA